MNKKLEEPNDNKFKDGVKKVTDKIVPVSKKVLSKTKEVSKKVLDKAVPVTKDVYAKTKKVTVSVVKKSTPLTKKWYESIKNFFVKIFSLFKKLDKKKKILYLGILGIVILIPILICVYNAVTTPDIKEFTNFDYVTVDEEGNYFIIRAKNDISFEVTPEKHFNYYVENNYGNVVKTTTKKSGKNIIINAPEGGYTLGERYTIVIYNGSFVEQSIKETKKIEFKIEREEVANIVVKKEVLEANEKNIKFENDIIETKESYNVGDIVLTYDGDEPLNAYKITSEEEDGKYDVDIPDIEEVFDEYDLYQVSKINLLDYVSKEEFEEETKVSLLNSEWYKNLVEVVDADEDKVEIEIESISFGQEGYGEYQFKITFDIPLNVALNKLSFGVINFKNHSINLIFEVMLNVETILDNNWQEFEIGLVMDSKTTAKIVFKYAGKELTDFTKKLASDNTSTSKGLYEVLKNLIGEETLEGDDIMNTLKAGSIPIPAFRAIGIKVSFDINLYFDMDIKIEGEAYAVFKTHALAGLRYDKKKKEFKPLGEFDIKVEDVGAQFSGNFKVDVGPQIAFNVKFLNIVEGEINLVPFGLYVKGDLGFKVNQEGIDIINKYEMGTFSLIKVEGKLFGKLKFSKVLKEQRNAKKEMDLGYSIKTDEVSEDLINLINVFNSNETGFTSKECFEFDPATNTITKYLYSYVNDDEEKVFCPTDNVIIPEYIRGKAVINIGESAFSGQGNLILGVKIPSTVVNIDSRAFQNNSLETIDFSGATSLKTIGYRAFANQRIYSWIRLGESLTQIDLSGATSLEVIESSAFAFNGLTSVDIPNSVKTIGSNAFENNDLTLIRFGTGVEEVGSKAFYNSRGYNYSQTFINNTGKAFDWNAIIGRDLFTKPIETGVYDLNSIWPDRYCIVKNTEFTEAC